MSKPFPFKIKFYPEEFLNNINNFIQWRKHKTFVRYLGYKYLLNHLLMSKTTSRSRQRWWHTTAEAPSGFLNKRPSKLPDRSSTRSMWSFGLVCRNSAREFQLALTPKAFKIINGIFMSSLHTHFTKLGSKSEENYGS